MWNHTLQKKEIFQFYLFPRKLLVISKHKIFLQCFYCFICIKLLSYEVLWVRWQQKAKTDSWLRKYLSILRICLLACLHWVHSAADCTFFCFSLLKKDSSVSVQPYLLRSASHHNPMYQTKYSSCWHFHKLISSIQRSVSVFFFLFFSFSLPIGIFSRCCYTKRITTNKAGSGSFWSDWG